MSILHFFLNRFSTLRSTLSPVKNFGTLSTHQVDKKRMIALATLLCEKVRQKERDGKAGSVLLKYSLDFFDEDDSNKLTRPEFKE